MRDLDGGVGAGRVLPGVLLASCVAVGCQPADLSGTVDAYVYRLDPATRSYALERGTVENLESLRGLEGRDVSVRAGSELNTGWLDLEVDRGSAFSLEWTQDADGVVRPSDLQSLYGLSAYRNLDRVASLLRSHGYVPERKLDVFYFPRMDSVIVGDGRALLVDNAAFVPGHNVFLIVPSFLLADVPMFLNEGVMAHEFGHSVIHQLLFAPHGSDGISSPGGGALHEGVADLIAFGATGDPNFIGPTVEIERDLSVPRDLTADDAMAWHAEGFAPHYYGSTMARAVYELWPKQEDGTISDAERSRMLDAILTTLSTMPLAEEEMTLAAFPDALLLQLPEGDRPAACDLLRLRLAPVADSLTHCGAP